MENFNYHRPASVDDAVKAMKSASENADQRVEELTLEYHKARQEAITRELIEIVAGAAAIDER